MKTLVQKVMKIQSTLNAPKNQYNNFGKYAYRNCEDILEALKPLLAEQELILTISDSIEEVSGRFYVKATVKVTDGENSLENTAYARESESKKGMDDSQVTGATSSYARKYALNGMFAIDDNKDADSNEQAKEQKGRQNQQRQQARNDKPDNAASPAQVKALMVHYNRVCKTDEERLAKASQWTKRKIESFNQLTSEEASKMLDYFSNN